MLPSVLLAAMLAGRDAPTAPTTRVVYLKPTDSVQLSEVVRSRIPSVYLLETWGDPQHLRNYPWGGGTPLMLSDERTPPLNRFQPPERRKPLPPAPAPPPDPTAERIKAIENVILDLKTGGGSAAVIEQLQHDLDELKAKSKKPK